MDVCVLTGKGKSGAVTVLQKSVRPNVVTHFPFPTNYNDMWTLSDGQKEHNSLLVITKKVGFFSWEKGEFFFLDNRRLEHRVLGNRPF